MWFLWSSVLCACAVLTAGSDDGTGEHTPLTQVRPEAGQDLPIRVVTIFDEVRGCYLVTPDGTEIEFIPEDNSSDRYELREPITLSGCQVDIKNVDENDNGIWEIYYINGTDAKVSQFYEVTVTSGGSTENGGGSEDNGGGSVDGGGESAEDEVENEIVNWLPTINYGARIDVNASITLSKKTYSEECSLRTPQGEVIQLKDVNIAGVEVYPTSTDFVSCRVVIGPMTAELLGTWTLCGRHVDEGQIIERCQPGNIAWAINDPTANWASTTHPSFDHVVHFGGTLRPLVIGSGTVRTCHVITPNGEDIVVTANSDYPGLAFVVLRDTTVCSITMSPIDAKFLGDWTLYGTYNSNFGFNVITLPMHLFLYDEENPYQQAYNVTQMDATNQIVHLGRTIIVEVVGTGNRRDDCQFITSSGEKYDETSLASANMPETVFDNVNNGISCRLQIGPITENMYGQWTLIGKFSQNNLIFSELHLPINIIKEDPANPIPDDSRTVEYLNAQNIFTTFGESHQITTSTGNYVSTDSCHIRTPDNLQYILIDGFNVPGVSIMTASDISCGVQVTVESEDMIGEWTLIARLNIHGKLIERRQPFTINIEVDVNALPREATVAEGNDLYLRLENESQNPETCSVEGPVRNDAEVDHNFSNFCGFIVRDVTAADSGDWTIVYGGKVKYKAVVPVNVVGRTTEPGETNFLWTKDASINETIGPEDAVYCKLQSPNGVTVFEGFGRCQINLDRVTENHAGVWNMIVATTGRVLTDTYQFVVSINEFASKAQVFTKVTMENPMVTLTCQLTGDLEVTGCKFRDPSGNTLLVTHGVGEDRYTSHGNTASVESNVTTHSCGLRIIDPLTKDLGLWRCAVETTQNTNYGFLSVLSPWVMSDSQVTSNIVTEPTLTAETSTISAVEGDAVTMRCSVQSAIRYCYFRAQNGTVFNVGHGTIGDFEYAGAGLDAGECSIRFRSLQAEDSGSWSCHVGFNDFGAAEQHAQINVEVEALMAARQYFLTNSHNTLAVEAVVHSRRALDYCRFVRIDGYGFTSESVPAEVDSISRLSSGVCEININFPTVLDLHPWTVVAKIQGQDVEIARTTNHKFDEPPSPEEDDFMRSNATVVVWSCVLLISLSLFFVGLMVGPKRNRDWTYRRAVLIRNSFRRSLIKKPLPVEPTPNTDNPPEYTQVNLEVNLPNDHETGKR